MAKRLTFAGATICALYFCIAALGAFKNRDWWNCATALIVVAAVVGAMWQCRRAL